MRITGLYVEECVKHGLAGAVPLQIDGAKCVGYYLDHIEQVSLIILIDAISH